MEKITIFCMSVLIVLFFASVTARTQFIQKGDLFSDNFEAGTTGKWQDMKVWGFGAWQVRDGMFISLDSSNITQQIYAAIPTFENAVLNRDFSTLFRFKPIDGTNFQFTIGVRQQGWSDYKFGISKDGVISIKKAEVGSLPETLFASEPGQIEFGAWQWVRVDVKGERPASFKMKIWQGDQSDEPPFYNAIALDYAPMKPANTVCSISMIQDGGAHACVDDFNVYGKIRPSKIWRWLDGEKKSDALAGTKANFLRGKLFIAESMLKEQLGQIENKSIIHNNLAIISAENNKFDEALEQISLARDLSPENEAIQHNSKWIWYCSAREGLISSKNEDDFPFVLLKSDKKVYRQTDQMIFKIGAFHSVFENLDKDILCKLAVYDSSGKLSADFSEKVSSKNSVLEKKVDISKWRDGAYEAVVSVTGADGKEFKATAGFEIVQKKYEALFDKIQSLENEISTRHGETSAGLHANDRANLEVKLLPLKKMLNNSDKPGYLALFEEFLNTGLAEVDSLFNKINAGENPFADQKGSFLRGYYSDIEGSLQGYAVHAPNEYEPGQPYPLVINLHGYDPGFAAWHENQFLPAFMPFATEKGRYIVANPFGRGNTMYQNIGENDVLAVMAEVKRLYSIDENRIYLTGGSMGGAGTWNIGLAFPDKFAALAPIMGPTEYAFWTGLDTTDLSPERTFILAKRSALSFAENASNLPMLCNHGLKDDIVPIAQSRKIVKRLRALGYDITYKEHPEAKHGGFDPQMDYDIYDWFEDKIRDKFPKRVVYKSASLKHNRAYWVEINRFADVMEFAKIKAEVKDRRTIQVRTDNISEFSLRLNENLVDVGEVIKISVNDAPDLSVSVSGEGLIRFGAKQKKDGTIAGWKVLPVSKKDAFAKTENLCGPILDAYNSGFMLVAGTAGSKMETKMNIQEAEAFSKQWEAWQHVPCRLKKDNDISENDIAQFNLILFGGPNSNSVTKKIEADLPIRFEKNTVVVGEKNFSGESAGAAFIYPNPLNRERYVVVNAGNSWQAMDGIARRIGSEFDYIIFDERTTGINFHQGNMTVDGSPLACGFFDQDWQVNPKYQWSADEAVREKIIPRKVIEKPVSVMEGNAVYLSDAKPDQTDFWTGLPEMDRNFWGRRLKDGSAKGIGVMPNCELVYILDGSWKNLSGAVSVDLNPQVNSEKITNGKSKMQFAVYGDDNEIYVSRPMTLDSEPQEFSVPAFGVKELRLVVRTQDWLPNFSQSGTWLNVKLEK